MRGLATYEVPSTDVNTPEQYHTWYAQYLVRTNWYW